MQKQIKHTTYKHPPEKTTPKDPNTPRMLFFFCCVLIIMPLCCELCGGDIQKDDLMVVQDDIVGRKYVHTSCFDTGFDSLLKHKNDLIHNMRGLSQPSGNPSITGYFSEDAKEVSHFKYTATESIVDGKVNFAILLIAAPLIVGVLYAILKSHYIIPALIFSPFISLVGIGVIYDSLFLWWSLRDVRKAYSQKKPTPTTVNPSPPQ